MPKMIVDVYYTPYIEEISDGHCKPEIIRLPERFETKDEAIEYGKKWAKKNMTNDWLSFDCVEHIDKIKEYK